MIKLINVADLVENNGKTVKENNLEKTHSIPIGTLVEIDNNDDTDTMRVYVAQHSRDCDGTPLYRFTLDEDTPRLLLAESARGQINNIFYQEIEASVFGNHSEESVKIASPIVELKEKYEIGDMITFKNEKGDFLKAYLIQQNSNLIVVSSNKNLLSDIERFESKIKFIEKENNIERIKSDQNIKNEYMANKYLLRMAKATKHMFSK